jgi:hypothetical protein
MAITATEIKQKATDWLNQKNILPCPVCRSTNRLVAEVVMMTTLTDNGIHLSGNTMIPTVAIVCDNCANIQFHAVAPMKLD